MNDIGYTNGIIAVKERTLLGEKLLRFPEMTAEEAIRALRESGFGGGEREGERLVLFEERALDGFIREHAPSGAELQYLLAPRDFHNVKAAVKAELLKTDPHPYLGPDGMFSAETILSCIKEKDFSPLGRQLKEAAEEALGTEKATGAQIGAIFEKSMYRHLFRACRFHPLLKMLLRQKVDRVNILTAVRASERAFAESLYLSGGTLKKEALVPVFEGEENALAGTPYEKFYALCAKAGKGAFTEAERELRSFEGAYFYERRFELEREQPFLYYVFRRRAEIENVRVILVCLGAGVPAREIERRLH